ncbi:hypothetical protein NDU88_000220 [Pleurodeles waltl]|uniref:Uncharacterized protein n=1 Tax=Pleurodeles waltl TaxID=8319 RepID=A0AAV7VWW9_PLEWA|nr:hypothetical protein NDU88_000220 [Pleurodeles waltl]
MDQVSQTVFVLGSYSSNLAQGVEPRLRGGWLLGDVSPREPMLKKDTGRWRKSLLPGYRSLAIQIGRCRAEAAWRMVIERLVAQGTNTEEGHRLKDEESVARLQEAGDSGNV